VTPPDRPDPPDDAPPLSLKRWSQRKHASRREAERVADSTSPASVPLAVVPDASPVDAHATASSARPESAAGADRAALPPVHTLTPESDFTRFFDAKAPVDDALKRAALKTLLRDPRFNVMDGLDTYVGDYTQSDPIPEGVLQRLVQAQSFVTPSPTPPGADLAQSPVEAALAAPAASIPPADSPVTVEPASPTSAAKVSDDPADAGKPTTT
jgi:Protein of unknown function (DUF3306)